VETSDMSRPLIGLTAYRKASAQTPPAPLMALPVSYIEAVIEAGGIPLLIPMGLDEAALAEVVARLDGLLLPGGGDIAGDYYGSEHPELIFDVDADRDRVESFLAREAVARRLPLLAICRGHQMLNVALGGTLHEDVLTLLPGAIKHDFFTLFPRNHLSHEVTIEPGSRLATALGQEMVSVNSLHHQGIRDLAPGLSVVAHAPDGLIEAVEVDDHPFGLGVQWHPENLYVDNPDMLALFLGLVEAARAAVRV
jgi:putative glutamine amidotransferase